MAFRCSHYKHCFIKFELINCFNYTKYNETIKIICHHLPFYNFFHADCDLQEYWKKLCPPIPFTTKYKAELLAGFTTACNDFIPGQAIGPGGEI